MKQKRPTTKVEEKRRRVQIDMDMRHAQALDSISSELDMTHSAVMRMSLRLFQMIHARVKNGEQLAFMKDGKATTIELLNVGLPS